MVKMVLNVQNKHANLFELQSYIQGKIEHML